MQFIDQVFDVLVAQVQLFSGVAVRDGRDPTVAARFLLDRLLLARCVQQQVPVVDDSVQFIDGFERPCDYA